MQTNLLAIWHNLITAFARSKPYLFWLIWASLAWSVFLGAFYLQNSFGYVSISGLIRSLILFPGIFFLLTGSVGHWIAPHTDKVPQRLILYWLLLSLAVALIVYRHYPPPQLALPAKHVLQIYSTGDKNTDSIGQTIEIQKLRYLNGKLVPLESITLSSEWDVFAKDSLVMDGKTPATLELSGSMPGGVAVTFRYNEQGGIAHVIWDGIEQDIDTFSLYSTSFYTRFENANPDWITRVILWAWTGLYLSGLIFFIFLLLLILRLVFPQPIAERVVLVVGYVLILAAFAQLKYSYFTFDDARNLRDTYAYVATASQPVFSTGFWQGERAFTVPLFFKLVGVNLQSYQDPAIMWRLAKFQACFSIFAWILLAGVVARKIRQPWLGLLGFTVVLFFSANLEISLWDTFLLSESISFSLFALLVALWIVVFDRWFPESGATVKLVREIPLLLALGFITVLFSYARDSNVYIICIVSFVLFGLAGFFRRGGRFFSLQSWNPLALAYLGIVLVLFAFQPLNINQSVRLKIHIYDYLAHRLFQDPKAVAYFSERGLPVSDDLRKITQMTGPEYRAYLDTAPEMARVHEWVINYGRSTYISYLLAYPVDTFLAPFSHLNSLMNGSNQEYRYPKYTVLPVPDRVKALTALYYPMHWPEMSVLIGITALSIFVAWKKRHPFPVLSWLVVAFWVAVYPLILIIWHGNPLEIERHAGQIGIMLRLAGWISLVLLLDILTSQPGWRKFWQLE